MPFDIDLVRERRPQNQIIYHEAVGSTMTEANTLATSGATHGTVVIADQQTAGIGRMGRSWISTAGLGIYCSVILRLQLPLSSAPVASLLVGLATADAVQRSTDLLCDLRWPNDVLIRGRKAAGILTQLIDGAIVAGIGINVNHLSFPGDLRTPATSLRMEANGRIQSREAIFVQLLASLDSSCQRLSEEGVAGVIHAFSAESSYVMHRRVVVEETGIRGVTAGLDQNGFLLLRQDDGRLERLASGGVRPVN